MYKSPRGTVDILPEEQKYWSFIQGKAAAVAQLYGYQRLDTPVFEEAELFTHSIGEGTDIVTKEMYIFKDLGDHSLALRPEGTAPICRAYLEHGMENRQQPVRLYYLASIFRYERPQAGRYRQHHQFGFEAIGEPAPEIDAEVIDMAWDYFAMLGLRGLSLQVNSIGCRDCRPGYLETLKKYYADQADQLCRDCQTRYEKNPLRLLDCKQEGCQSMAQNAPRSVDFLCPDCGEHFSGLQGYLQTLGLEYNLNHRLVRGLDYYTRTVFEIQPPHEGSQSALGGGGRYDGLIQQIGGKATPALGFGCGMERVILNLKQQDIEVPEMAGPSIYIASLGGAARKESLRLAGELRRNALATITASGGRSLKAQLRQADGYAVDFVLILGEDEINSGSVTLRNMKTGTQQRLPRESLLKTLSA